MRHVFKGVFTARGVTRPDRPGGPLQGGAQGGGKTQEVSRFSLGTIWVGGLPPQKLISFDPFENYITTIFVNFLYFPYFFLIIFFFIQSFPVTTHPSPV